MSYDAPPPPPPGATPPPPPPAGGPYFPAAQAAVPKAGFEPLGLGIAVAGVLALIFSFVNKFYTVSATLDLGEDMGGSQSISDSGSAWHGVFGWLGVVLAVVAAIYVVLAAFDIKPPNVPAPIATAGVLGLAFLCELVALFVVPAGDVDKAKDEASQMGMKLSVDEGHGWSYWLVLVLVIVALGLAVMKLLRSRPTL